MSEHPSSTSHRSEPTAPPAEVGCSPSGVGSNLPNELTPPAPRKLRRAAEVVLYVVLIVALWAAASLWKLGAAPFYSKGEPREALVVWEMTHGGGWVLPRRNGTELPSKPPLFHWLAALSSFVAGEVNEATLRFPSAILSLLGLLLVFVAGSLWWSPRLGFYASLILLSSFEWARAATNARVDMTLTVGLEAAFLSLTGYRRSGRAYWLAPLYAGMTWATLAKGPVGIALPVLVAGAYFSLGFDRTAWRERRWRNVLPWSQLLRMRPIRGLGCVFLVAGLWYGLALWQGGYAFFRKQILAENVFTFLDDPDFGGGHRHGLFYLPIQLLLGFLPWSLLLPLIPMDLWRQRKELGAGDLRLLLLTWVLVVFAFYELAASKRGVYLLALYPALALLTADAWHRWEKAPHERPAYAKGLSVTSQLGALLSIFLGLVFVVTKLGVPWQPVLEWLGSSRVNASVVTQTLQALPAELTASSLLLLTAALWWAARWFGAGRVRRGLLALFAGAWAATVGVRTAILPAYAEQVTLRDFMHAVRSYAGSAPVYFFQTFDYQAVYYSFGRIPVHDGDIGNQGPPFLLVSRAQWEQRRHQWENTYRMVSLKLRPTLAVEPLVLIERTVPTGMAPQ